MFRQLTKNVKTAIAATLAADGFYFYFQQIVSKVEYVHY